MVGSAEKVKVRVESTCRECGGAFSYDRLRSRDHLEPRAFCTRRCSNRRDYRLCREAADASPNRPPKPLRPGRRKPLPRLFPPGFAPAYAFCGTREHVVRELVSYLAGWREPSTGGGLEARQAPHLLGGSGVPVSSEPSRPTPEGAPADGAVPQPGRGRRRAKPEVRILPAPDRPLARPRRAARWTDAHEAALQRALGVPVSARPKKIVGTKGKNVKPKAKERALLRMTAEELDRYELEVAARAIPRT